MIESRQAMGLLNVYKPSGVTSRQIVNQIQRVVRPLKVGHAGTLDPLAEGVLVLGVGAATRLIQFVQRQSKVYLADFLLGRTSDTDDVQGEILELEDRAPPTTEQIQCRIPEFLGTILQRPPQYSAIKVGGQRAYRRARRGESFELSPREVQVHQLELLEYAYPHLRMRIVCGSGTYVRSLGRDLADRCGTGAVMSALCRAEVGVFDAASALRVDAILDRGWRECLLPARLAVAGMPVLTVDSLQQQAIRHGRPIHLETPAEHGEIAAVDRLENLLAVLVRSERGWRPGINFC